LLEKRRDEFPRVATPREAHYMLPWEGSGKRLFKAGVSFDPEKRKIGDS